MGPAVNGSDNGIVSAADSKYPADRYFFKTIQPDAGPVKGTENA